MLLSRYFVASLTSLLWFLIGTLDVYNQIITMLVFESMYVNKIRRKDF